MRVSVFKICCSRIQQTLDYSAGISDGRVWTPSLKKFWVEICDQGRECQKDFRVTTFFANLDPTPACPPWEALSSVILVGFQFRCVQDGRKPDNQMPNVTCGRVWRSASPSPANSSWKMSFKVLLSSNLQIHFRRSKKIRSQVSYSMLLKIATTDPTSLPPEDQGALSICSHFLSIERAGECRRSGLCLESPVWANF